MPLKMVYRFLDEPLLNANISGFIIWQARRVWTKNWMEVKCQTDENLNGYFELTSIVICLVSVTFTWINLLWV